MTDEIYPAPAAAVVVVAPEAVSLAEMIEEWKDRGLEPVEVARADTLQQIVIVNDPLDGTLTWKSSGPMDALQTVWLVVTAAVSMGQYFTAGPGRVDMPTGECFMVIGFKDGRLSIQAHPQGGQLAVEKLLATVLAYFWEKNNGRPVERFLRAFGWEG